MTALDIELAVVVVMLSLLLLLVVDAVSMFLVLLLSLDVINVCGMTCVVMFWAATKQFMHVSSKVLKLPTMSFIHASFGLFVYLSVKCGLFVLV